MSKFIKKVYSHLAKHPKRIVFTDGEDIEVIRGAVLYVQNKLGTAVLIGERSKIRDIADAAGMHLDKILIIDPSSGSDLELFAKNLQDIPRFRGISLEEAVETLKNPCYYASMMLRHGQCDGLVAGRRFEESNIMRPLMQLIKPLPGVRSVSSCMIVDTGRKSVGDAGVLFLADASIILDPSEEQLAGIAYETALLKRQITGTPPRIAFISYSTKGSVPTKDTEKITAALHLLQARINDSSLDAICDGELQPDAALNPFIARIKAPDSPVQGNADVLIFPDMKTGNISSKLLISVMPVHAYGHIFTGILKPAAEIYRGIRAEEIVGVAAIVALQAIEYRKLYPLDGELDPSIENSFSSIPE